MHQRIAAILLLIIFLHNSVGYYFLFKVEQYQAKKFIKSRIKSTLSEKELILLSFHPSASEFNIIEWIEDHEFYYKGHLYDIVKQSQDANGVIHYFCVNDKQEERLFANLDADIKRYLDSKNDAGKSQKGFKKDVKDYLLNCTSFSFPALIKNIFYSVQNTYFDSASIDIFIPPPNCA